MVMLELEIAEAQHPRTPCSFQLSGLSSLAILVFVRHWHIVKQV